MAIDYEQTFADIRESIDEEQRDGTILETVAADFPRFKAYLVSYLANQASMNKTLESFRQSDWGEDPVVLIQPPDWPVGADSASRNYKRALEAAVQDGCDFAVIVEDDVGNEYRATRPAREPRTSG